MHLHYLYAVKRYPAEEQQREERGGLGLRNRYWPCRLFP